MLAPAVPMGIYPLWSLGSVTRLEAKVKVVDGFFVGDDEGPRVGSKAALVVGAQV